jgi:hypothetical protein
MGKTIIGNSPDTSQSPLLMIHGRLRANVSRCAAISD